MYGSKTQKNDDLFIIILVIMCITTSTCSVIFQELFYSAVLSENRSKAALARPIRQRRKSFFSISKKFTDRMFYRLFRMPKE